MACVGSKFGEVATVGEGTNSGSSDGPMGTTGIEDSTDAGSTSGSSTVTGDGGTEGTSSMTGSSTVTGATTTGDESTSTSSSDAESSESTGSTEESSSSTETGDSSTTDSTSESGEETTTESGSESNTSSEEESGETGSSETTGDDTGVTVRGIVTRSAEPFEDNDGIGTLYVSVLSSCNAMAESIAWVKLEEVDLSADDAEQPFAIEKVPNGKYYVAGYLDDNENANPDRPVPDKGDIIPVDGFTPKCVEVNIDGVDVSGVSIDLNRVIPF